ncbi:hypothetical protein LTR85_004647 [Meristemomyces frigidus]|nr:hypothetical protein LTR85_004647 [Meristemomyces frigidus]
MDQERFLDLPTELRVLVGFLEDDDRPSAILDMGQNQTGSANVLYRNAAFKLLEFGRDGEEALLEELAHAQCHEQLQPHRVSSDGRLWISKGVGKRWTSLVCTEHQHVAPQQALVQSTRPHGTGLESRGDSDSTWSTEETSRRTSRSGDLEGIQDWTRFDVPGLSHYIQFVRDYDWAATGVGPMETWPIQLRQCVVTIMKHPHPRCIIWGWGREQTIIYNESCAPWLGSKHPASLGQPMSRPFAELWNDISALFEAAYNGTIVSMSKVPLPFVRSSIQEETHWDLTLVPIIGPDGRTVAVVDEFSDCSQLVRGERRHVSALALRKQISSASQMSDLWPSVLAGLEPAKEDVPFAIVYTIVNDVPETTFEGTCGTRCVLEGTMGLVSDNAGALHTFSLSEQHEIAAGLMGPCLQAWKTRRPVVLSSEDGTLPQYLKTAKAERCYGDELRGAVVTPIVSLGREKNEVLGLLVVGLNPRCPYDQDYSLWIRLLRDLVENTAALISLPEEQRRAKQLADDMNNAMAERLQISTLQAERSDARFVRMANSAPTGMYVFDPEGKPLYVNDTYLDMIGQTREEHSAMTPSPISWQDTIHPDDMDRFTGAWAAIMEQKGPGTVEYRLQRPWKSVDRATGQQITGETWLLASAFPDVDANGNVSTVQGWLTDISYRKFSERLSAQRLEDALEHKRQTENFIDMTSHEMRNPLSAILQSADSIVSALDACMPILHEAMMLPHDVAEEIVDAAQTIILCGQHQKRIVDDILTLSKLDASLLIISPDKVQPPQLVKKALKMFESDIARADITTQLCVEPSYTELGIDWVILDSSRLLQVVINLLTNAIKFTQYCDTRKISLCLGVSKERPTGKHHNVNFIPVRKSRATPASSAGWGKGEDLYLQISVSDTGRGLTEEETRLLFQRFAQASPKTYKQYGGSGLGLFISRELSELQGGQIGVSSGGGKTTFTFFVKVKRWVPEGADDPVRLPLHASPSASASPMVHNRKGSIQLEVNTDMPSDPSDRVQAVGRDAGSAAQAPVSTSAISRKASVAENMNGLLHVLIVEDNHINQKVMSQQLRRAGCIVHVANHGLECLSFLEKSSFCGAQTPLSVILLDMEMPTMDGLTCIRHIRAQQAEGKISGHVPVIAVTANARSEQISMAIEAGMDQVVTKPFRIPDLVPRMRALADEVSGRTPS